jgi:hypothetical protein
MWAVVEVGWWQAWIWLVWHCSSRGSEKVWLLKWLHWYLRVSNEEQLIHVNSGRCSWGMDFRVVRRVHSDVISVHLDDAMDDDLFSGVDLQGLVVLACDEDAAMYCSRW